MRGSSISFVLLIFFLFLSSCGDPEFVKEVPNPPKIVFQKSYVVQKIIGDKADILWVVDNSGSMASYQKNLIHNMDTFIQSFTEISSSANWKMGLLSTDIHDGPYVGFDPTNPLDFSSIHSVERFNSAISRLGVNGDTAKEQAFGPIRRALTRNPHFLRKNSKLFIIIVSDELEQSGETVSGFLSFLHTLRAPQAISTYGIFEAKENGCGREQYEGTVYHEFIEQTNGLTFPICSLDYGTGLAAFGADIAKKIVTPKIILESPPVIESIRVTYQDKNIPSGIPSEGGYWRYDANDNSIVFHDFSFFKETGEETGEDTQETVQVYFEKSTKYSPLVGYRLM